MNSEPTPTSDSSCDGILRLAEHARTQGSPDSYSGKRRCVRYKAGMRLDLTVDPDDPALTQSAIMHDACTSGCSFWSKRQITQRTRVFIRDFAGGEDSNWLPALVQHCTVGIRGYLIGVAFDEPAPAEPVACEAAACNSATTVGSTPDAGSKTTVHTPIAEEPPPSPNENAICEDEESTSHQLHKPRKRLRDRLNPWSKSR
ncbi:MAG: hypothetical protein JSU63_17930 [Phycisphaerales bacterium]|nr:MAG: hypothetical protein JSU63_17930 [Phycisphaerales bacterium]